VIGGTGCDASSAEVGWRNWWMELVQACRRLADAGLVVGTAGNVSVRVGKRVSLTAKGVALSEVTTDDVAVADLDGKVLGGSPTSELELHLAIYRRYEASAIVHTHATMVTSLACVLDELPVIHYQLLALGGAIRVAPFHPFGTEELAAAAVDALSGRTAALLANHGAINYASSLAEAVEGAFLLEWACALYLNASRLGTPQVLDEVQQTAVRASAVRHGYRSLAGS
jgi:L-fuculose-phosphate aldolase